jgi:hypothetical protein
MDNSKIDEYGDTQWRDANGYLHRDDGPAVIHADGGKSWYQHSHWHRDDGPAVIYANGTKVWYQHGNRHRDDGPAIEWPDGGKSWFQHGVRHRDNGPAVIWADGSVSWYLDATQLTFNRWLDRVNISDEDKVMMKLKYG